MTDVQLLEIIMAHTQVSAENSELLILENQKIAEAILALHVQIGYCWLVVLAGLIAQVGLLAILCVKRAGV